MTSLGVKRQEVVSGLSQAADRCQSTNALMWPTPVVVMDPTLEHGGALLGMSIEPTIGPLAQGRLDEALGFAICLGAVGAGECGV